MNMCVWCGHLRRVSDTQDEKLRQTHKRHLWVIKDVHSRDDKIKSSLLWFGVFGFVSHTHKMIKIWHKDEGKCVCVLQFMKCYLMDAWCASMTLSIRISHWRDQIMGHKQNILSDRKRKGTDDPV